MDKAGIEKAALPGGRPGPEKGAGSGPSPNPSGEVQARGESGLHMTPPRVAQFRHLAHRILLLWLYLLNCWATKYLSRLSPGEFARWTGLGDDFRLQNYLLQHELAEIFAPHAHICITCQGGCCGLVRPYFAVDELFYGGGHQDVRLVSFSLKHLWNWGERICGAALRWKFLRPAVKEPPAGGPQPVEQVRCVLLTESGCRLPLGERIANCIIFLCPDLARLMTWQEFFSFMRKATKYLWHLTVFLPQAGRQVTDWHSLAAREAQAGD